MRKKDITTHTSKIQKITEYFKTLYSNKLENPDEMDRFLDTYELPNLKKNNINNRCSETEAVIECPNKEKNRTE
jgi:hypothetical protein